MEKRLFWGDEFKDHIISACRTPYTDTKWKKIFRCLFYFLLLYTLEKFKQILVEENLLLLHLFVFFRMPIG